MYGSTHISIAVIGYRPTMTPCWQSSFVSGKDREETVVRARHALESFVIEGITTTISFLHSITLDEQFVAAQVDTGFIDRFLRDGANRDGVKSG